MRGCLVSSLLDTSRRQSTSIEAVKKALTVIYDKQGASEALDHFRLTKAIPLGFVTLRILLTPNGYHRTPMCG